MLLKEAGLSLAYENKMGKLYAGKIELEWLNNKKMVYVPVFGWS